MKKLITFLFISVLVNANAFEVRFGDPETSSKKNRISIIGSIDNNIYVYKYKVMPLGIEKHTLVKYDPTSLQTAVDADIEIKRKNYEGMRIFNGKILVFQQEKDAKASEQKMYYDVYDGNSLNLVKEKVQVAKFQYKKGLFSKRGGFKVITSEDNTKLCAYYDLPYEKGKPEKFGFTVFDESLEKMYDVNAELPQPDELMNLGTPHLSNEGVFYTSAREVLEKTLFGRPTDVTHHIYKIDQDGILRDYKIDLVDKYIYDYTYGTNQNGDLVCSGLYGFKDKPTVKVNGAFYVRMDGNSGDIAESSYKDFPLDFITAGWSDRLKKKAEKQKKKGKVPTLYKYDVRDIVALEDGGAVLTAEQFYIRVVTYRDANGNTRTTYYYYYNDIIVVKLNKDGKFDWYAKIPKYQVSTNDGGYYSSYSFHVGNGKLYFMFNDNMKNYEDGNVVGGKTYATSFTSNKKNVTSLVEMDIADGKNKKVQLFSKGELGTIAVPKIHSSDRVNNKLFIFGKKGKKERLGVITF